MWIDTMASAEDEDMIEMTLQAPIYLHAGAVQYIKEAGHEVPDSLIPPEYVG